MARKRTNAIVDSTAVEMRVVTIQVIIDQNSLDVEAFDVAGNGPYNCHLTGTQAKEMVEQLAPTLGKALKSATLNSIPLLVDGYRILADQP